MKPSAWLFLCLLVAANAGAQSWPYVRTAPDDPRLPERWSATENIAWKTEIPGTGWSSPVVSGDRVFLTAVSSAEPGEAPKKGLYFGGERPAPKVEHRWMVYAVDFNTGKILWEREAFKGVPVQSRHLKNSYASETPVTDGERLYAYFGNLAPVGTKVGASQDSIRLGHRGFSGPLQRPSLHAQ